MLGNATLQTIVCTARMTDAARFYENVLGLRCVATSHGARVYDVGGGELRLSPVPSVQPSEHTVVGFSIADLAAALEALEQHGVPLVRFPGFPHDARGVVTLPDGTQVAWIRDPDGNLLSVVQYGRSG